MGQRGELSGAPHLPGDVPKIGGHFFGLELVGHRPPRKFIGIAQRPAGGEIADFNHRAVDHIIQAGALLFHPLHLFNGLVDVIGPALKIGDREMIFL